MEPERTEASSVRISPKVFSDTMTSKSAGFLINCMAALSTRMCSVSYTHLTLPTKRIV